jgi:neutral ceramidase
MATHTHSGPGGCGYEALYNMPTPGFVPEHLTAIVEAIVLSIQNAIASEQDTEIFLGRNIFQNRHLSHGIVQSKPIIVIQKFSHVPKLKRI